MIDNIHINLQAITSKPLLCVPPAVFFIEKRYSKAYFSSGTMDERKSGTLLHDHGSDPPVDRLNCSLLTSKKNKSSDFFTRQRIWPNISNKPGHRPYRHARDGLDKAAGWPVYLPTGKTVLNLINSAVLSARREFPEYHQRHNENRHHRIFAQVEDWNDRPRAEKAVRRNALHHHSSRPRAQP